MVDLYNTTFINNNLTEKIAKNATWRHESSVTPQECSHNVYKNYIWNYNLMPLSNRQIADNISLVIANIN